MAPDILELLRDPAKTVGGLSIVFPGELDRAEALVRRHLEGGITETDANGDSLLT